MVVVMASNGYVDRRTSSTSICRSTLEQLQLSSSLPHPPPTATRHDSMDVRSLLTYSPSPPAPMAATAEPVDYLENGRLYHGFRKGSYMYPCDEVRILDLVHSASLCRRLMQPVEQDEKDRMDIYHKFFSVARRDVLHKAPFVTSDHPSILDLGCGTGIWAIDMAE
jgi:hypothetical protein